MSWKDAFTAENMYHGKGQDELRARLQKLASEIPCELGEETGFWSGWGAAVLRTIERGPDHMLLQMPLSKTACAQTPVGRGEQSAYALLERAGQESDFVGWLAFVKTAHDAMLTTSPLRGAAAVVINGAPSSLPAHLRSGYEAAAAELMRVDGDMVRFVAGPLVEAAVKFSR